MNYHNITTDDMLNGDGLRTVLWVSGCNHHCNNCQNKQTWDKNSGIYFGNDEWEEILSAHKPLGQSCAFIHSHRWSACDKL